LLNYYRKDEFIDKKHPWRRDNVLATFTELTTKTYCHDKKQIFALIPSTERC